MLVHRGVKFVTLRDTNSPDWPLCNHPAPIIHLNNVVLDTLTLLFTSFHVLARPFDLTTKIILFVQKLTTELHPMTKVVGARRS